MHSFISVNSVRTYCSVEICSVLWITVEPQMKAHTRNQQEVAVNKGWSLMREGYTLNGEGQSWTNVVFLWWGEGCTLNGEGQSWTNVVFLWWGGRDAHWMVKDRVEQMWSFFDGGGGGGCTLNGEGQSWTNVVFLWWGGGGGGGGVHIEQWRAELNKCGLSLMGGGWGGGDAYWTVKGRVEQMWPFFDVGGWGVHTERWRAELNKCGLRRGFHFKVAFSWGVPLYMHHWCLLLFFGCFCCCFLSREGGEG